MPHIPIYASEDFQGTSKGSVYGDVIEEIDFNVGRLVNLLKEKDIYDNTIFIYTSDNGPWLNYGNHAGTSGELRGGKFDVFEGGYRVPCVISWPNVIKIGIDKSKKDYICIFMADKSDSINNMYDYYKII